MGSSLVGGTVRICLLAGIALLAPAGAEARADESEVRDFTVLVDGKRAGDAHMNLSRQEDGTTTVNWDTDITVTVFFFTYRYTYRGQEVWKDGRLQSLESSCNDDGKRFVVSAAAEGKDLRVRVNSQERLTRGDVWLTSYWEQPDAKVVNQVVPLLDADTGRDLDARVQFLGTEQRGVAGQTLSINHYRLTGKVQTDLWYDPSGRLVREEWIEQGHRTVLELSRLHRQ
jgi:hypothetical protein